MKEVKHYIAQYIDNGKKYLYKKTETEVTYITTKAYKEILKQNRQDIAQGMARCQIETIGAIRLKAVKEEKDAEKNDTVIFEKTVYETNRNIAHTIKGLEVKLSERRNLFWYVKGYIPLATSDKYVQYCKSWLPLLLIILCMLGCIIGGIIGYTNLQLKPETPDPMPEYAEEQQLWDGDLPRSGQDSSAMQDDTTQFPGYSTVVITKKDGNVQLVNPTGNTVDFTYTISDSTRDIQYTTSKIRPGNYIDFAMGKLYPDVGEYLLNLQIATYDVADGSECTSVTMPITLIVLSK
jgi:hypothetical protein